MNTDILYLYFLQYQRYENLIYNPNIQKEERERYLLLAIEANRKMEVMVRNNYGW